jgi:hypothetical protein
MEHKDLFSGHAKLYAAFRPSYPTELYEFIYQHLAHHETAWDCGTGNGQVAHHLVNHFKNVKATDISDKQLKEATAHPHIDYSVAPAEKTSFPDNTFDLITVGQDLHWLDREKFYPEAIRVGKDQSLIAVWGYSILSVNPELDKHLHHYYKNIVGPYWDKARQLVDEEYQTISFPFEEIPSPRFFIKVSWDLHHLAGYLESWSATQRYISEHKTTPVGPLLEKLQPYWQDPLALKTILFPLFLRLGIINKG